MRIILIIQTLIIIAGAYYFYTEIYSKDSAEPVVREIELPPPATTTEKAPAAEPVAATTSANTTIAGPNDAGMEWPVLEEDLETR
jgi:hypothetical protein